ncbi:UNVERIFIED_ORG: hypothetical protein J3D58_003623 [Paenarthrobacter nicotinovorans]
MGNYVLYLSRPLDLEDWLRFMVGDLVWVKRVGENPAFGRIEDINDSATIFWVQLDDTRGRILVHDGDGTEVRSVA